MCFICIFFLLSVFLVSGGYYDTLQIDRSATPSEVKRAYRAQALKWHPDKNPDDREGAEAKFREIAAAYEVLSNAEVRQRYDSELDGGYAGGGHEGGGGGFGFDFHFHDPSEIFKDFFGTNDPFANFEEMFEEVRFEKTEGGGGGRQGGGGMDFDFGDFGFEGFGGFGGGGGGSFFTSFSSSSSTSSGGYSERVETVIENGRRVTRRIRTLPDGSTEAVVEKEEGGETQRKIGKKGGGGVPAPQFSEFDPFEDL